MYYRTRHGVTISEKLVRAFKDYMLDKYGSLRADYLDGTLQRTLKIIPKLMLNQYKYDGIEYLSVESFEIKAASVYESPSTKEWFHGDISKYWLTVVWKAGPSAEHLLRMVRDYFSRFPKMICRDFELIEHYPFNVVCDIQEDISNGWDE